MALAEDDKEQRYQGPVPRNKGIVDCRHWRYRRHVDKRSLLMSVEERCPKQARLLPGPQAGLALSRKAPHHPVSRGAMAEGCWMVLGGHSA